MRSLYVNSMNQLLDGRLQYYVKFDLDFSSIAHRNHGRYVEIVFKLNENDFRVYYSKISHDILRHVD